MPRREFFPFAKVLFLPSSSPVSRCRSKRHRRALGCQLPTQRLCLRRATEADVPCLFSLWSSSLEEQLQWRRERWRKYLLDCSYLSFFSVFFVNDEMGDERYVKVAWDSCDVTHSLKQASIHTSHVHGSKSCTKYSPHLVQSTSTH